MICLGQIHSDGNTCLKLVLQKKKDLNKSFQGIIYVVADETLDSRGPYGTTCSQAILESLNQYSVAFQNVLGLVSDSVRYTRIYSQHCR
ncbi:hypothetical protein PR048_023421 [Dryococelus australis]|uniref:Uncharacterized protein n=1 Tax=Dryococelus australis TaxID=614101 RepID=A0ABQ9GU49_9NEOP|nr:hypothetical protein PR048_023421 [Dryococelus australis]